MSLEELVAQELRDKPANISDATGRQTHRRWDSFAHVQMLVAIEQEYGVKFANAEIERAQSVGEIRQLLVSKGVSV